MGGCDIFAFITSTRGWAWRAAFALHSSTEAAALSTQHSGESWIAHVGRYDIFHMSRSDPRNHDGTVYKCLASHIFGQNTLLGTWAPSDPSQDGRRRCAEWRERGRAAAPTLLDGWVGTLSSVITGALSQGGQFSGRCFSKCQLVMGGVECFTLHAGACICLSVCLSVCLSHLSLCLSVLLSHLCFFLLPSVCHNFSDRFHKQCTNRPFDLCSGTGRLQCEAAQHSEPGRNKAAVRQN